MPKLYVLVKGCDDTTRLHVETTHDEAEFLRRFASEVNAAADGGCQPRVHVFDARFETVEQEYAARRHDDDEDTSDWEVD